MNKELNYKLLFLKGTKEYVITELLEKYPKVNILKQDPSSLVFETEISDIEEFRNLLSPVGIINEKEERLDLSKREWRVKYVPAGINPSLAYVMCMIGQLREQDIVYDPFCGASTLPITALKEFNVKRVICSDMKGSAIEKSKENFKQADIGVDRYMIFRSDISKVKLNKRNVDVFLSNLPFGIRVGTHDENIQAYIGLEACAKRILRSKGKLILLTQEKKLLREVFKKEQWRVKSVLRVNEGGLLPEVFDIRKRG